MISSVSTSDLEIETDAKGKDAAWVHAKLVDNAEAPEESSLDQLRLWLDQRSIGQIDMYRHKEWHEFRMLASAKGPIEKLVKAVMPISRLGRIILVSIYLLCPASVLAESSDNTRSALSNLAASISTISNLCATKMQSFPGS